jgi:hypothetical protein
MSTRGRTARHGHWAGSTPSRCSLVGWPTRSPPWHQGPHVQHDMPYSLHEVGLYLMELGARCSSWSGATTQSTRSPSAPEPPPMPKTCPRCFLTTDDDRESCIQQAGPSAAPPNDLDDTDAGDHQVRRPAPSCSRSPSATSCSAAASPSLAPAPSTCAPPACVPPEQASPAARPRSPLPGASKAAPGGKAGWGKVTASRSAS